MSKLGHFEVTSMKCESDDRTPTNKINGSNLVRPFKRYPFWIICGIRLFFKVLSRTPLLSFSKFFNTIVLVLHNFCAFVIHDLFSAFFTAFFQIYKNCILFGLLQTHFLSKPRRTKSILVMFQRTSVEYRKIHRHLANLCYVRQILKLQLVHFVDLTKRGKRNTYMQR